MKITVNKCPHTGKLFEDEQEYFKHLRRERTRRTNEKRYQDYKDNFQDWLRDEKEKIATLSDIPEWIIENQVRLYESYNAIHPRGWSLFKVGDNIQDLKLEMKYSRRVSNTHSKPRNGVTNWACNNDLPIGYEGFTGDMHAIVKKAPKSKFSISDLLGFVDIHTGSGGSSNGLDYGYECRIYLSDWPSLEQQLTINKLKGTV